MTEYLPMCLSRFLLMYGNAHIGQPLNIMMVSNCLMTALGATAEVTVRLILEQTLEHLTGGGFRVNWIF